MRHSLFGLLLVAGSAYAGPLRITQQGRLLDAAGGALNDTHDLTVSLHDAETGGAVVWEALFASQSFENGWFTVTLTGTGTGSEALDAVVDGRNLWMSLSVDGQVHGPRQLVAAVPEAAYARVAAEAAHASTADTATRAAGVALVDVSADSSCNLPGGLAWDSDDARLYVCTGTEWQAVQTGDKRIQIDGGVRRYADGSLAASCNDYRNPTDQHEYAGDVGDGLYRIAPSGSGGYDVYCDMTTNGGGWTMVLRVSDHDPNISFLANGAGWQSTGYGAIQDVSFTNLTATQDHVSLGYNNLPGNNVLVRERLGGDLLHAVYTNDGFLAGRTLRTVVSPSMVDGGRACSTNIVYPNGSTPHHANYDELVFAGDEAGDTEPGRIVIRTGCSGDAESMALGYTRSGHGNNEVYSQGNHWSGLSSMFVFVR